jgi:trimeric autotransporter adhesin
MGLDRLLAVSLGLFTLTLAGCGVGSSAPHPTPVGDTRYSGSVHGGQQPVVGASIQLYTVGTTADGSAATPLLTSTVTSDATGSFTITGLYSCTNATQVYIVATGGNPGLSTTNPNIALMAALGPCSSLTPSTFININELTTVAAVAALAPYMTSATAIGSSSSDAPSLANAFTLANEYVNTTTGTAPGTGLPSGYTVPVDELNTLADIVSACINSTGGIAGDGSLCGNLFSLTTIQPNPAPTNTITALLNIVNNPSQNAAALFALVPPTPPFQPTLTSAPPNWQIQLIPPPGTGPVTLTSSANFTILGALQDLTLSNQGATPVNIASILESDSAPTSAPYFTVAANNCGTSLAAQTSCTISVASSNSPTTIFGPAVTVTGTVTVTDDAGTQTASLTSADTYEVSVLSSELYVPSSGIVSFPATQVGSTKSATTIYYSPLAGEYIAPPIPLALSGANPSDFSLSTSSPGPPITGTACTNDYTEGNGIPARCAITASFTPSTTGSRSAKVSLDPSFGTPTGQYILLQGTGLGPGPSFIVNAGSLSLESYLPGNIDPRSAGSTTLTLTNNGTTTVSLAAGLNGAAAPYLSASVSNCSSVAANATCQFTITFNGPTAPGTLSGNLVLSDANSTFTLPVPVTGTTAWWQAVPAPGRLTFANQALGTTSSSQNFVIADPNGYPLGHAYTVALQPSSNFALTQGATCPASTTQTCTLAVAFDPQAYGLLNEVATITDQTTNLQSQLLLSGSGGSYAAYSLSTTAMTFPTTGTGTTNPVPLVVILTSNGNQPVSVSSISISGAVNNNFSETNNCSTIAVNSTCAIPVLFTPTATGSQSATLQIASNAVNSPASVSLTGSAATATGTALQIAPTSVSFSSTGDPQTVTVTNTASYPVTIGSTSISGTTGTTLFTISSGANCAVVLSPGGSCTITLTVILSSSAGSANLVIYSDTPDSPQSVALSAPAAPAGSTSYTVAPTSFTYTIWGANKDYTVTNTGSAPLTISSVNGYTTGGEQDQHRYSTSYNGCSTPTAAGATCSIGVQSLITYAVSQVPNGVGGVTGQIAIGSQTINVLNNSGPYILQNGFTNGTVNFPSSPIGSPQTATLELVNTTSGSPAASLTIGGANSADFSVSALEPSVSSSPSASCPGGGTAACTITVTFKPTALGPRSAEISLDSSSTSTGQYIYVSGTGTAPLSGPSFTTSTNLANGAITVTNTGNTTLQLAFTITGANASSFAADTSQCQSVAPQATCSVPVTYLASPSGSNYSATLFLYDQSSSASATISLYGTVPNTTVSLSFGGPFSAPFAYTFPSQQENTTSPPVTFTVTDGASGVAHPVTVSLGSSGFILTSGSSCPVSAQPCTLSVAFSPQSTGTITSSLIVTDTVTGAYSYNSITGVATQ